MLTIKHISGSMDGRSRVSRDVQSWRKCSGGYLRGGRRAVNSRAQGHNASASAGHSGADAGVRRVRAAPARAAPDLRRAGARRQGCGRGPRQHAGGKAPHTH